MKLFPIVFLIFSAQITFGQSAKIATVDFQKIFQTYEDSKEAEDMLRIQLEALFKDPRVASVREIQSKIDELSELMKNPDLDEARQEELAAELASSKAEHDSLNVDAEQFLKIEQHKLKSVFTLKLQERASFIHSEIQKIAAQKGFELTLDISGKTSSTVSPIVYLRNGEDITDLVISQLNKSQSPVSE